MYDPFKHIDEMITHFVSDEIRDVINVTVTIAISYLVGKNANRAPRWWTLGLIVATLFLFFLIGSAIEAHRDSILGGFNSGSRFAFDIVLSMLLIILVAYPFSKRFLPNGSKRLDWAKDRNLWTHETSPKGAAGIIRSTKGLQFRAQFTDEQNRWGKMEIIFKEPQDYHTWAGISFDIKCDRPYPDTDVRLEVKVPNVSDDGQGSIYRVEKPIPVFNGRPIFLFQEMWQPHWSLENPWGYLNLRQIISVAAVCNSTCDVVEFYVDNFALVKFTDVSS